VTDTIEIQPVAGALGAEIRNVDLSGQVSNATYDAIHSAFLEHEVIFLRDQQALTPEQHVAFGRRFGSLNIHPYVEGMAGHPEVLEIIKEPDERLNFGGGWHSDLSYIEKPALGSILHAIEVPPVGGDTLFASQSKAYEALSEGMKDMLGGLTAIHSAAREYSAKGHSAQARSSMNATQVDEAPEYEHPVIRTHPESGRKSLYVNPAFTMRFKNMTRHESKPLLNFLFDHCRDERFTCRFRWTAGAIAFWDNRAVWHYALNDYHGHRRHMRRVTVNGDRPV
jgi:taurine dioxygenase